MSLTSDAVDRILVAINGGVPASLNREELRNLDSILSLHRTGLELRSRSRRREITRAIDKAKQLKSQIEPLGILFVRFQHDLNRLIAALEADCPPKLAKLLDIDRGVSPFENVIRILADRYRHHFDEEPGYTTGWDCGEVDGRFIDFAEAALIELGITNDGSPYSRKSIANALSKVRRVKP
jgi:hypothetical protein